MGLVVAIVLVVLLVLMVLVVLVVPEVCYKPFRILPPQRSLNLSVLRQQC